MVVGFVAERSDHIGGAEITRVQVPGPLERQRANEFRLARQRLGGAHRRVFALAFLRRARRRSIGSLDKGQRHRATSWDKVEVLAEQSRVEELHYNFIEDCRVVPVGPVAAFRNAHALCLWHQLAQAAEDRAVNRLSILS